jgi:hypothetical protein
MTVPLFPDPFDNSVEAVESTLASTPEGGGERLCSAQERGCGAPISLRRALAAGETMAEAYRVAALNGLNRLF